MNADSQEAGAVRSRRGGAVLPQVSRSPESWRSRRPSRSATSATWRSPIRRASPRPASPSATIRRPPPTTPRAPIWSRVISNGTAVLGLGNIGPLASKPVMEGKAVLFKKFAGIDVFDIEIDAPEIDRMVETISALEPTFGGINLEDIKAPECFEVEEQLQGTHGHSGLPRRPARHRDHRGGRRAQRAGTRRQGRSRDVKIVTSGAGAAALACLNLLVSLGARRENIWVTDLFGVAYKGRVDEMDRWKDAYVKDTDGAHAGRRDRRRRRLPRPVGRRRAEAGTAGAHGGKAADPGARQSRRRRSCRRWRAPRGPTR